MNKVIRKAWVAVLAGVVFQFGGCGPILQDVAINAVTEFIWDSDVVFDFFGDDGPGLITQ
jgi:hypothetical protein